MGNEDRKKRTYNHGFSLTKVTSYNSKASATRASTTSPSFYKQRSTFISLRDTCDHIGDDNTADDSTDGNAGDQR